MQRFACLLVCLLALPATAQEASREPAPATGPAATELPLPATPIPVPTLSPQAGKPELLAAYYGITGGRMFEVLMAKFVQPPVVMQTRVAGCHAAQQLMDTHYRDIVQPHFRGWLDNSIRPRILTVLDESFGEAELRAFLRFAATPNGQRHLNQIATQGGKGDVSHFPEFLEDADLRSYDRQFDALGGRVDDVLGDAQTELMTPEFMVTARESGQRIADLVAACKTNAATKP